MSVARMVIAPLAAGALLLVPATAVAADATSTALGVPATPPKYRTSATLTATVTNTTSPATTPTGKVQFSLDGAPSGAPVTLVGGVASTTVVPSAAGDHQVRADYLPDAGFVGSSGPNLLHVDRAPTTTAVQVTPTAGVAGQDVQFQAQVSSPVGGIPTGTVTLSLNGVPARTYPLDGQGRVGDANGLWAGSHAFVLTYNGDPNYAGSDKTTTVTITPAGTVIVLTAAPNPAPVGQPVTFDATVDSIAPSRWWPSGTLTGAVDGVPVPGSAVFVGRADEGARFVRSFATPGTHTAAVHFTGDEDFLAADASLAVTVTGTGYENPSLPSASRRPLAPRGLTLKATPKRDRRAPYAFTVTGTLQLPSSVSKADGCSGRVTVTAKRKAKRVARKTATVTRACTFKITFSTARKGTLSVTATFGGNARVAGTDTRAVKVRAG